MIPMGSVSVPRPSLATDDFGEDDDIGQLLFQAGPLGDPAQLEAARVLIVAVNGLGLLRGLIRRGCPAATCIRPAAKPEAAAYEFACFPDIGPETNLEQVVRNARRAVVPGGRLTAHIRHDRGGIARGLARRLKLNGFVQLATLPASGGSLLWAELPISAAATHARDGLAGPRTAEPRRRMS
jgi:hypothetical protein